MAQALMHNGKHCGKVKVGSTGMSTQLYATMFVNALTRCEQPASPTVVLKRW